ncbi:hypothetical protein D3C78_1376910 [compost metagenome]
MQQHLLTGRQRLGKTFTVQAVIQVQALAIKTDHLRLHPYLGTQLYLMQVVQVAFQGKQRVAAGAAVVAIKADTVHEGIGGVTEDQQIEGIAQMPVVIDPVRLDRGLVGDQCRHPRAPFSR